MKERKIAPLTDEELEIEEMVKNGEFGPPVFDQKMKDILEEAASNSIATRKESRVNIRMTDRELDLVKAEAAREGIPYQTLMSSIIHKYLTKQLIDRRVFEEIKDSFFKKTG